MRDFHRRNNSETSQSKSASYFIVRERRSIATRETLLSRLKNWEDQESWRTFYDLYWRLIFGQAISAGLTKDEAEEVVQETVIEICRRIQTFQYKSLHGSFKGWLFRLTRWRITNQFHKRPRGIVPLESADFNDSDLESSQNCAGITTSNWDESWERDWRETIVDAALKNIRRTCDPKHFQVFELLTVKEWSPTKIAVTMKMNRAHIYLVKCRIIRALRREIVRLERI